MDVLKVIENCVGNKKKEGSNGGKSEEKDKSKKDNKKRKVSFRDECVPKKSCPEKLCDLCKKHSVAHMTNDRGECRKFTKDGTLEPGFKQKRGKAKSNDHNFAQVMKEGFAKVTKAFKQDLNSLTPMVAYMRPIFLRSLELCSEFLSFGPTSQMKTSKVSCALLLQLCCLRFEQHTVHQ